MGEREATGKTAGMYSTRSALQDLDRSDLATWREYCDGREVHFQKNTRASEADREDSVIFQGSGGPMMGNQMRGPMMGGMGGQMMGNQMGSMGGQLGGMGGQ